MNKTFAFLLFAPVTSLLTVFSVNAYTLPTLPLMPSLGPAASANSLTMGDPLTTPEVQMGFFIETNGPFQPTWTSIASNNTNRDNGTPAWLRQAKFGIWVHYGPQANLQSGDWSAQHMYQQGSTAYNYHLANFGYLATNGYKDVIRAWSPTNYSPAGLAQLYYNAGARFVLVQGAHHDNFDNWNSHYNPWNAVNLGPKRDTLADWTNACHNLGMRLGVAFHHEYSWWFYQPAFLSDSSGTYSGVSYDAVTATNSAGQWWASYDTRRLYNVDLHKYQGITTSTTGYWNPVQGIFSSDLDYGYWYATQWALRIVDVVENYDPDFIYTDGTSPQPFSGYGSATGYKCNAMERVIAHYSNRTLQRHGKQDTFAVVKFHPGDNVVTTSESSIPSGIINKQAWIGEMGIGDWFWKSGISYDSGGSMVTFLLECVSRDGAVLVNISPRPDGALDSGATNMLTGFGQWMATNSPGIYGSHAWVKYGDGTFRFTVGTNGFLYAYYLAIPAAGTKLTIPSLATSSNLLAGAIGSVSLLGSGSALTWSQTSTGLVVTCPATMPVLPSGTAIGFKIGPASAIGSIAPVNVVAAPGATQIALSWDYPTTTATFNVSRATAVNGPYTSLATGLAQTTLVDTNVSAGTLYFYVVSAVDIGGQSTNSPPASAVLTGAPSSQWLTEDVGAVGATGSFGLTNGLFTIQGSGADIWNQADAFRYGFQSLTGDCSITARVLNQQSTASWAKAGVMIRETLDASSKYVINFVTPTMGVSMQQRANTGGSASSVSNPTGIAAPYWVRLVRAGDTFTASVSPDGINWVPDGVTIVPMNTNVCVGLAVCSVKRGTLCQAQFTNVTFSSTTTVVSSPLPQLIHRYSFNETSGTNALDSIGGANGTLKGSAAFDGNGRVVLNGTSGTYVALPGNLLAGLSNVTLTGTNTFTGDISINGGGTLAIGGGGLLGGGNYAGNISSYSTFAYNSSGDQTMSGNISLSGAVSKTGRGTLTLTKANDYSGSTTLNSGQLALSGNGGILKSSSILIGNTSGSSAAVYQSGSGTLMTPVSGINGLQIGSTAGGFGYYNLSAGSIWLGSEIGIGGGSGGAGTFGQFDLMGGGIVVPNSTSVYFLLNRGGAGESSVFNVSGGFVNVAGNGTPANGSWNGITANWSGSGAGQTNTTTISGTGQIILPSFAFNLNEGGNSANVINLNLNSGGILQVLGFYPSGGTSLLNFNGGTLKAGIGAGISGATFLVGLTRATIYSNGATIDDNG
jgi:alpha-L-fucosidase